MVSIATTPGLIGPALRARDWMLILLGLILDISKWMVLWGNRSEATRQAQRYYPSGAPGSRPPGGTSAAVSSGPVPPSGSPAASEPPNDESSG